MHKDVGEGRPLAWSNNLNYGLGHAKYERITELYKLQLWIHNLKSMLEEKSGLIVPKLQEGEPYRETING